MRLLLLFVFVGHHVDRILIHLQIVELLNLIHVLVIVGVLKHLCCVDFNEHVSRQIISEVSEDQSSPPGF